MKKFINSVSLAKALTWRVLATLTTIIISYLVTGRADLAMAIGGFEVTAKILIYYIHERAWDVILIRKKYSDNSEETEG